MEPKPKQNKIITLGKVIGVFGVQGWVKVYSHTAKQEDILNYKSWHLLRNGSWSQVAVLAGKRQGKGLIARFENVNDRDAALALNGTVIGIPREDLPELAKDEYYWSDLIGLNVSTLEGLELGTIDYLFETGANDVMVVKGDRERWLPWIMKDVVKSVDLSVGSIVVDWDPDF